jgi:dsRNA-specific ribonuclease
LFVSDKVSDLNKLVAWLRLFTIQIVVDGENYAIGRDYNKKNAEKIAAEKTCGLLDI